MSDELRKLAEAATPRPWYTDTGVIFGDINNGKWNGDNPHVLEPLADKEGGFTKRGVADAKFATYCVNSHDALTARVAELEAALGPFAVPSMRWAEHRNTPTIEEYERAAAAMEGK